MAVIMSGLLLYTMYCMRQDGSCKLIPAVLTCMPFCIQVESGRYHIYIGNACPWCHRVLLALIVRGLLPHISYTIAADDPERASRGGWVFDMPEPVFGCKDLR